MIRIETVDGKSPYLEDVKRLWRLNSDWLGRVHVVRHDHEADAAAALPGELVVEDAQNDPLGSVVVEQSTPSEAQGGHEVGVALPIVDAIRDHGEHRPVLGGTRWETEGSPLRPDRSRARVK